MNHIHRLIWNSDSNTWVAVAENARGRGKSSSRKLVAAALSLVFTCAQAGPLGGVVASGAGTITQAGSATTIVQTTPNLSLNWKSFNVGATESVKFVQPSTNSVAVNRIFDANGSQILGRLSANGQVYLINTNGILFGKGAQVNVGGLVASTLGFNDASLGANARVFSGSSLGSVVNLGSITTAEGGFVALVGNTVSNQGTITAPRGKVMLGGASAATLNFANNALVSMKVDQSVFNTLVENGGLIKADGGSVALTAGTQTSKAPGVVRQVGYIQARTLNNQNGIITLLSGMATGTVYVDGTLDASAPQGGNGGFIETSAAKVRIGNDVKVSTAAAKGLSGKWLIDPTDFTISAIDPGNGDGFMSSATLAANLKTGDVAIQTSAAGSGNGDINVNDAISWNTDHVLTLTATKNINVNANITATGNAAGMVMSVAGTYRNGASITLSGATPTLKIAGIDYTVINSLGAAGSITGKDLQGIGGAMAGSYALGSNIDARPAANWNANTGFMPISSFAGTLDGLGHSITDLTMDSGSNLGLISIISAAGSVKNIGLVNVNIKGASSLGGLAAINAGTVSSSYSTGIVRGTSSVGGLIGSITTGTVSNSYSMANVFGTTFVGGLAGSNAGLVNNIYATGNVNAASTIGGLFGHNAGTVNDSLATGNVTGTGGTAGGLTGSNAGTVNNSYSVGKVVGGPAPNGGLMGTNAGTVNNSYWDTSTSGQLTSAAGAIPLNTTQMQTQASFNGWDFTNTWGINAGASTPYLKSMLNHVTVTANNTGKTYDGKAFTGNIGVSYSNFPDVFSLGAVSNIGLSNSATNVGTYAITPFVTFNNPQFVVSYASGQLTINPAPLTIASPATRPYDGSTVVAANLFPLNGLVAGETLSLTGSGAMTDKNVGVTKPVSFGTMALGNGTGLGAGLASNYTLSAGAQTATITRLAAVNWTGKGSTVSWFDPLNWAGGAVPDMSNVADVVIPTGFNVNFNNLAAPVNVDSVTSSGVVNLASGTLNVATKLSAPILLQSGGALAGSGAIDVNRFDQTGGSIANTGSFTVAQSFKQTAPGAISVGGNVAINQLSGDLSVSNVAGANVSLTTNTNLSLGNVTAAGKLNLLYGQGAPTKGNPATYTITAPVNLTAGANFSTTLGSGGVATDYTVITALGTAMDTLMSPTLTTLQGVANVGNLGGKYVLGSNIDASFTADAAYNGTAGFIPIGDTAQRFTGVFDGLGHTVSGLMINLPAIADVGLFGFAMGNTVIQNVGLVGGSVLGGAGTGGLVGNNDNGSIRNSFNTGTVTGGAGTGGLVGHSATGNISNSYTTGLVIGAAGTGGLLGTTATGNVSSSYATGAVAGTAGSGGLVGTIATGEISNSYAKGDVAGGAGTGGLVGTSTGPVTLSYASGNVTGTVAGVPGAGGAFGVGGLIGTSTGLVSMSYATGKVAGGAGVGGLMGTTTGVVSNTFATGNVSANSNAGGLMGDSTSPVSNSYATGKVTGAAATTGALMGTSTVTISNNFYDSTVNPGLPGVGAMSILGGATGLTSTDMLVQTNFTKATAANGQVAPAWDFDKVWTMAGGTKPLLMALLPTLAPTAAPTAAPTTAPTATPTVTPTVSPTTTPTLAPTTAPTASPSASPTTSPTSAPTSAPTDSPTASPTAAPTASPTATPTAAPTATPTTTPSSSPTAAPSAAPGQPNAINPDTGRAELRIAVANTAGKLQSDASRPRVFIGPASVVKIKDIYSTTEEAANDSAQVLSSNEIRLQIIDEGMQLTQTLFFPDEDE